MGGVRAVRARRWLGCGGLSVWFVLLSVVAATLLARHTVALPRPTEKDAFAAAIASLRGPNGAGQWLAVHVLMCSCGCSAKLAEHLAATERPSDVAERVLLGGSNAALEAQLSAKGFQIIHADPDELYERYRIQAVPLFVVLGPDDVVRYSGGYTTLPQGPDPEDLSILESVRRKSDVLSLPIFGCAASAALRNLLNPLRLP